jgi:ribosomal protein S18 acetylase RimI-like enzyme
MARPDIRTLDDAEVDSVGQVLGLARLHQGNGHYLVAWIEDEPAGHAYLTFTDPPELQDVEVREDFRRRGVARSLVDAAEASATQRGASALRLNVSARNDRVQALYRSLGFEDTGLAPVTVRGTIEIRTGPLDVDDVLLTWEKALDADA